MIVEDYGMAKWYFMFEVSDEEFVRLDRIVLTGLQFYQRQLNLICSEYAEFQDMVRSYTTICGQGNDNRIPQIVGDIIRSIRESTLYLNGELVG